MRARRRSRRNHDQRDPSGPPGRCRTYRPRNQARLRLLHVDRAIGLLRAKRQGRLLEH